jgi:hypothetical protein
MYEPDRAIAAALRRISRDLSAAFVEPPGRWAIFDALQVVGNFDATVDRMAEALQREASSRGHVLDRSECAYAAAQALKEQHLVCYVTEDDGGFRPLDGRILEKLRRMNYWRENFGLGDWKRMLNAKADVLRAQRQREDSDLWDVIRRDKVFARFVSDILWGTHPVLSIVGGFDANDSERQDDPHHDAGAGAGPADPGSDGDALPPEVDHYPVARADHAA